MKKALVLAAMVLALGATGAAYSGEFEDTVAKAEAKMKEAKKADFLWRDTGKILKKAKEANKAGDTKKAMKGAKKALQQAELAIQQSKDQANPRVVYPR
ncbi:MAG TPA: hypothetical protein ENG78_06330 [Acidiferrobacteraceae bacterium]|nr:hypothetical protein [Acidiferrobacteraceae bacterium]HEX20417.1 hypothetical protein [Acidiferrobacteraceae bacterium]